MLPTEEVSQLDSKGKTFLERQPKVCRRTVKQSKKCVDTTCINQEMEEVCGYNLY